jgi:hypothetical protein
MKTHAAPKKLENLLRWVAFCRIYRFAAKSRQHALATAPAIPHLLFLHVRSFRNERKNGREKAQKPQKSSQANR